MTAPKTAALLIGFGGPTKPEEVRPFLESVLEGIRIPEERFKEVLRHYEAVGGVSLYNSVTYRQKEAIERWFQKEEIAMPVGVGFRHSFPSFKDAFETFKKYSVTDVIGFVLSPFRCHSSFEKYKEKLELGRRGASASAIPVVYTADFSGHPLFIEAQAACVSDLLRYVPRIRMPETCVIFSAHSVPVSMSDESGYAAQFEKTSALVASKLALSDNWRTAYQSRTGRPGDPWLGPDVKDAVAGLDRTRFKNVLLITPGFLCDHVEVVYDLDVEVKEACRKAELDYFRAPTVADHPKFIEMAATQILQKSKERS